MAVIVQTFDARLSKAPVNLTLTAKNNIADTFTYYPGTRQVFAAYNTTANDKTVTFVGSAPVPFTPDGFGAPVDTSAGKSITVPANGWTILDLDDIWPYLAGSGLCSATGGNGLMVALYN